jgi:hypothetical protein
MVKKLFSTIEKIWHRAEEKSGAGRIRPATPKQRLRRLLLT